jgi:hypothetical protein
MRLCQYRDSLGVSGQGIHSRRFMGLSINDVLMTFIGAFLVSKGTGWDLEWVTGGLFLLGIFLHWLFCVSTTIGRALGLA